MSVDGRRNLLRPVGKGARHQEDEQRLFAAARSREAQVAEDRDLLGQILFALGFVLIAAPLASGSDGSGATALTLVVLVVAFAVASRIEFDVGHGYTQPTQLVFVPMLFLAPAEVVPVLVAGALMLGRLPDYVRGRRHPVRIVLTLCDSWYALGPAIVFVAAGVDGPQWSDWPIYAGALAAQFAFDFAAAAGREWIRLGVRPQLQMRLMWTVYAVDACLSPVGLLAAFAAAQRTYAFLLVLPLAGLLAFFARERRARLDQALELSSTYRRVALLLGDVVGDDDAYTGLHSQGVVSLAVAVADELRLPEHDRQVVEFGALLHDVGKIAIPKSIINKRGPLDDAEWAVMRTHTVEGQRMLDRVGGSLREVGVVVRASHERWDGGGYPDGLAGEQIPLAARIVTCADAFSAMTTDRPYRPALARSAAIAELLDNAGTHFDPRVAEATVAIVERYGLPRGVESGAERHASVA
jgi:putative nucleotidyltransferase with HDIG domain